MVGLLSIDNLSATYQLIRAIEMTFERTEPLDKHALQPERQSELSAHLWKNMQTAPDSPSIADPALDSASAHLPGLVLVADNVGKNNINNKPNDYLNPELIPEVAVLDNTKPGDTILRWGNVPQDFYDKLNKGWQSLPDSDKLILKQAGVTIAACEEVRGENGSPASYDPVSACIKVGLHGFDEFGSAKIQTENPDPTGSMKHEVGHALYVAKRLGGSVELSETYKREAQAVPPNERAKLAHMLGEDGSDGESETCAELYASLRGRDTDRTQLVNKYFTQTKVILARKLQEG